MYSTDPAVNVIYFWNCFAHKIPPHKDTPLAIMYAVVIVNSDIWVYVGQEQWLQVYKVSAKPFRIEIVLFLATTERKLGG